MEIVLLESLGVSPEEMTKMKVDLKEMGHSLTAYERTDDIEKQKEYTKDAEIIILANMPLSGEVIKHASKLKFINIAFTGVDHVDIKTAKECNVAISNASGYSTQAVAELAIAMMIELLRNVRETEQRCRLGLTKDGLIGNELSGKTVGIIGVGKIGRRVAKLAEAFDCKVLGHQRNPIDDGIEYCSLEELLQRSDIVSLHCPATESTHNLINKERLSLMKKSAILINTARGLVVNQEDLAMALNNDQIAAAGIDVFDIEPPLATDHILLKAKNTLVTPHIAFATKESMVLRKNIVVENIRQWGNGTQINII